MDDKKTSDTPKTSGTSTSGRKNSKKFRYKLHPDPNFDPLEYILTKEIKENVLGHESYQREIKNLRFGIYRVYVETVRKSSKIVSIVEDRFRFSQFLENNVVDIRIYYGFWMYSYHIYLVFDLFSKITFNLRTFLDLVLLLQFTFYGLSLFSKIMGFISTETSINLNLTYFISGALTSAFWCLPGNDIVDYPENYQNIIWKSIVQWLFFLFCNRYYLSLIHWENENLLRIDDEQDIYESEVYGTYLCFKNLKRFCHKIWVYSIPSLPVLIWEIMGKLSDRVSIWPGFFWLSLISIVSTSSFRVFLNFFSFQYQCLVWIVKWRKGIVIRRFDKHDSFGIIH